jgi:UPF0755 protein
MHRILGVIVIAASFALAWLLMDFRNFVDAPLGLPREGVLYQLEPGSTVRTLATDLYQRGLLERPLYLRVWARWDGSAQQIKAGEYRIGQGTTPRQLLEQLAAGKVVSYSLTLVEGWTFDQVLDELESEPVLKHTLEGLSAAEIMERMGHAGEHPEGRFLPDSYHFPRGTADLAFLRRAYDAMQRLLDQEWAKREPGLPLASPYEALILASIVEKETGLAMERPLIAGVFIRRLKRRMKLQTDPTVIYGMGAAFDGNIRRKDLKAESPYNTYLHKGLPPTPIAMPGAEAIRAVLHPAPGNNLYFVARGDGSHEFSDTLKAHNRAVRKYQLKRHERGRGS